MRETFNILWEYPLRFLQHTFTFASGLSHPPERTVLSHSDWVSKSYSFNHCNPAKQRKDERLEHELPLRFQEVSYPS